jgi:hypothetical protein
MPELSGSPSLLEIIGSSVAGELVKTVLGDIVGS